MTAKQGNYLKENWLTLANFILLVTLAFRGGYNLKGIEDAVSSNTIHITENIKADSAHQANESLHMPFENKIDFFVPRTELENRIKNIEETQNQMRVKQDKIYLLLLNKN